MSLSDDEICDFAWQYEQRRRWVSFSDAEMQVLNKAVKEKQNSVSLVRNNSRKQIMLDLRNMVQRNKLSSYEQRIRCLVPSSGFCVWLWRNENDEWCCYQPTLAFHLEIAYQKKEKKLKIFNNANFEINMETLEQINEETHDATSVKRETVQITTTAEVQNITMHNEDLLKRMCSSDLPSSKRIKVEAPSVINDSRLDQNITLQASSFNPMIIDDSQVSTSTKYKNVPVDSEFPERENYHIYCEGDSIFTATLNQTNLQNNNNKFYIIQLLEHNQKKLYSVWRRWGRDGYKGQCDHTKFMGSLTEAKSSFEEKFHSKTRNDWNDVKNFVHVKGKYDLLHMDLNPEINIKMMKTDIDSKLPVKIQSLLEMICDQKKMEEIMKEMSYDSNKTPLGKLTLKQVRDGYIALNKIAAVLSTGKKGSALLNACNEFYTKIPHNFGMKTPPIIQSQSDIDDKLRMLEALSNITVAMSVLNAKSDVEEHPLDKYYKSLNCLLKMIDPLSSEYKELENCLEGTHGPTHTTYKMEIIDAFKCCKEKEETSFVKHEHRLLLWHGSRITNWLGILKEGLRIAPPEAPTTGYMFGKGIYFADVSSKSANYCFATRRKNEGLLLLCEVSVGNQFHLTETDEDMPVGLPSNCNSVLGKGRIDPSDFKTGILSSEAKAPYGPLKENGSHQGSLHYNEYIVYNVKQVKMKYLIRVKFNFQ